MTDNVAAPPTSYQCMDCDWEGTIDDLASIDDIHERVDAGELMPAGQCPECGMLVPIEEIDVPEWVLKDVALVMRGRGWLVVLPSKTGEQAEAPHDPNAFNSQAPSSPVTSPARGVTALPSHKPYIDAARSQYTAGTDDIEIDDEPTVAPTNDGVWVAAWVWIGDGEVPCSDCAGAGRGGANTTDGLMDDDCRSCSGTGHAHRE